MTLAITYEGTVHRVEAGTTAGDFLSQLGVNVDRKFLAVRIGHELFSLSDQLSKDGTIVPITIDDSDGMRVYKNSAVFLLTAAFRCLYPSQELVVNHTISGGIYCTVEGSCANAEMISNLIKRMRELIAADQKLEPISLPTAEAVAYFEQNKVKDTADHLRTIQDSHVLLFSVSGILVYTFGLLVPSAGYVREFEVIGYASGFILRYPGQATGGSIPAFIEQPKLFSIFREYERWQNILDIRDVHDLNGLIENKKITEIVHVAEALHEKKLSAIADEITRMSDTVRVVLIAGPSSSGKTTFSKRLAVHLKVNGIQTLPISMDNYFKNRDLTPHDEDGAYDFESLYALDLDLFNDHLTRILAGETVRMPKYNFTTGLNSPSDTYVKVNPQTILILEGIHCLNDELTSSVYEIMKYKIYVSAFTPIGIDSTNRIPTTDLRLTRRIVRDNFYRSYSAADTLSRWHSVRRGEKQWIFPHQNKANAMFNTTLIYEPAVLKSFAQKLLAEIGPDLPVYEEARRLHTFLSHFTAMDHTPIPGTSILREFIGGSHFKY